MKLFLVVLFAVAPVYKQALPGYRYQFPRDHFEHPDFRTEWWYYTGNVHARDGHRYGFELVFFRQGEHKGDAANPSVWRVDDLYLAHLALTDIDGQRFLYYKRLNRSGPGIAGASERQARVWNGNWEARWDLPSGVQTLKAVAEDVRFTLRLAPRTAPVIHGEDGVSQKAAGPGKASYYVSLPLLDVSGTLNGADVTGSAWMDHEWFTHQLEANQQGWDWFSAQLDSGARTDAVPTAPSRRHGRPLLRRHLHRSRRACHASEARRLPTAAARLVEKSRNRRRVTRFAGASRCPRWVYRSNVRPRLTNQELVAEDESSPSYWEGAVSYRGSARGVGYLEMTGYNRAMHL